MKQYLFAFLLALTVGCKTQRNQSKDYYFLSYMVETNTIEGSYVMGAEGFGSYHQFEDMIIREWECEGISLSREDITIIGLHKFDSPEQYFAFFKGGTPPCTTKNKQQ